jgi:predicted nucleotidyltransferase
LYDTAQILNILSAKKKDLERRYPIRKWHYSVHTRGVTNLHSDIDILMDFSDRIDGFDYIRIAHELEDAFTHKIDPISRQAIKQGYLPFVEKNLIHV